MVLVRHENLEEIWAVHYQLNNICDVTVQARNVTLIKAVVGRGQDPRFHISLVEGTSLELGCATVHTENSA